MVKAYFLGYKKQVDNMFKDLLVVHIKIYKGNFFFIISNTKGKLLFVKTAGVVGFKDIEKRSILALTSLLLEGFNFILKKGFNIFLKLEGANDEILKHI